MCGFVVYIYIYHYKFYITKYLQRYPCIVGTSFFKNIKITVLKSCIKAPGRVLSSDSNEILGKQRTEDPAQCFRRGETVTVSVSLAEGKSKDCRCSDTIYKGTT